jgi:hypothetical protein
MIVNKTFKINIKKNVCDGFEPLQLLVSVFQEKIQPRFETVATTIATVVATVYKTVAKFSCDT